MGDEDTLGSIQAFRPVPRTGVIYVSTEAARAGYHPHDSGWANLGQGQPETGALPSAPERRTRVEVDEDDLEYSPVAGLSDLRAAVADLYNRRFRQGMPSQYSAENVAISGGGRAALTRAAASLSRVNLGHFIPDYTAYEELLDVFRLVTPIPILLEGDRGYEFTTSELRREILGRGLSAILLSNPCNPTGKLVSGDALQRWVSAGRDLDCALLFDEFYSNFIFRKSPAEPGPAVSAARYVEDVDRDPIVIFDGLTKNWRYPGWRVTWTVGPKDVIEAVTSAGSFLDGGGSRPLQRAAVDLVSAELADQEATAIQSVFAEKRELMLTRAKRMGFTVDLEPDGTFYVWAGTQNLPPAISDGMSLFREALRKRVIVVPGEFFDVNPGKRRRGRTSRFKRYVRLSFGPEREELERGLDGLEQLIAES